MTEQVSARTMRRFRAVMENRMERLESHLMVLVGHVERLVADKRALERANETLRQVPAITGWTRKNEAALIAGMSDAALKRAAEEAQE